MYLLYVNCLCAVDCAYKRTNISYRFREDVASSSTFTLEDSAICLTSEQSTMDVDIDRDDGSVLDVYLVSYYTA